MSMPAIHHSRGLSPREPSRSLESLVQASRSEPKVRAADVAKYVDDVCEHANLHGLSATAIDKIVNAILPPGRLDQVSQNSLIKSLFPSDRVSSELPLRIISSLGVGKHKASNTTQSALLKWLALVLARIVSAAGLVRCYHALFNLLDHLHLRAPLCHLLAKITQKKHVRPCRVERLEQLEGSITFDTNISKMMDLFEYLCPGTFKDRSVKLPVVFPHPDPHWVENWQRITYRSLDRLGHNTVAAEDLRIGLTISGSQKSRRMASSNQVRDLHSVEDIAMNVENFDISASSELDFGNPYLQSFLDLCEEAFEDDEQSFLISILEDQDQLLLDDEPIRQDFLEQLLAYVRHAKMLPLPAVTFFEGYLPKWQPTLEFEKEPLILEILTYLPILRWSELNRTILRPLEAVSLDTSVETLITLLDFYTTLFRRWTAHLVLQSPEHPYTDEISTLAALSTHSGLLALTLLTRDLTPSQRTTSSILSHLESWLQVASPPLSFEIPPPQPLLICTLLFASPSLSTLSRTSSLLARYKQAFEAPPSTDSGVRNSLDINVLNSSLLDTCNLLLRSRAFNTGDPHAQGCLVPPALVASLARYTSSLSPPIDLSSIFSLSSHMSLASLSIAALRDLEEAEDTLIKHTGPVGQRSLAALGRDGGLKIGWREYRVHVLKWMEAMGANGIGKLGSATMKGLMGEKAEKGRQSDASKANS